MGTSKVIGAFLVGGLIFAGIWWDNGSRRQRIGEQIGQMEDVLQRLQLQQVIVAEEMLSPAFGTSRMDYAGPLAEVKKEVDAIGGGSDGLFQEARTDFLELSQHLQTAQSRPDREMFAATGWMLAFAVRSMTRDLTRLHGEKSAALAKEVSCLILLLLGSGTLLIAGLYHRLARQVPLPSSTAADPSPSPSYRPV